MFFGPPSVAVLVLTMFLSDGTMTSRAVNAPTLEDCQIAAPLIAEQLIHAGIKIGAGATVKVEYVDTFCHLAKKGQRT